MNSRSLPTKRRGAWVSFLALTISLTISVAVAQTDITGTVVDGAGKPVAGCIVALSGDTLFSKTSEVGRFSLSRKAVTVFRELSHGNHAWGENGNRIFRNAEKGRVTVDIFDLKGKTVGHREMPALAAGIYSIHPSAYLSPASGFGLYTMRISTHSQSVFSRFLHDGKPFPDAELRNVAADGPLAKVGQALDTLRILCDGYGPIEKEIAPGNVALGSIPVAKPQLSKPNILFAIADDWSYPHAGAYGAKFVHTPAFDRVAREGALFHNAFYSAPQCAPSRASIVTGRNIWENEEGGSHASWMPEYLEDAYSDGTSVHAPGMKAPVRLEVFEPYLTAQGYLVAMTGKGVEPFNSKRPEALLGRKFGNRTNSTPTSGIDGNDYAGNFNDMLAARKPGQPFFFWYGSHEPHRPYTERTGFNVGKKKLEDVVVPGYYPDEQGVRYDFLDYALEVDWFDNHLAKMIARLEALGELDNTIIIVTGDNGMPFPRGKANLYDGGSHAPFAIRWGRHLQAGRVISDFVSFVDLAPTFLELAGSGPGAIMTGRSFVPLLLSKASGQVDPTRDRAYFGMERHSNSRADNVGYPTRAVRTKDYLYIRNFKPDRWPAGDPPGTGTGCSFNDIDDGTTASLFKEYWGNSTHPELVKLSVGKRPMEELYDLRSDSLAMDNKAGDPAYASVKEELWKNLEAKLKQGGDPRVLGYGDIWEAYPRFNTAKCNTGWFEIGKYNPDFWSRAVEEATTLGVSIRQIK